MLARCWRGGRGLRAPVLAGPRALAADCWLRVKQQVRQGDSSLGAGRHDQWERCAASAASEDTIFVSI
eukprot:3455223-Lingulodinium_polyedra.AAC.1